MGITVPTLIQRMSIQAVLDGRDVIAKAETGTGKTLAFCAPMLSMIDPERTCVLALVLCPTRELAQQVAEVAKELGHARGLKVALIVGGDPLRPQIADLRAGAQVVVGTPGRILDLQQQRYLSFPWTEWAVLDEADKMLEIGFLDDIRKILATLPQERRTLLFSATYAGEVLRLARDATRNPLEIATAKGVATVDAIAQCWIAVPEDERADALAQLIMSSEKTDIFLVFCERRTEVDRLVRRLDRLPGTIRSLHGGYDQDARFRVLQSFRNGEIKALIATDVASRGLDVLLVTHVLNYSVPRELEDYTHRIGRTGRAGRSGVAITFVHPRDRGSWERICRRMPWDVVEKKLPTRSRPKRRTPRSYVPRGSLQRNRGRKMPPQREGRRTGGDR